MDVQVGSGHFDHISEDDNVDGDNIEFIELPEEYKDLPYDEDFT